MSRGCSFVGRLLMLALVAGILVSAASGLYRSGYRQGFVQGAVIGATDGHAAAPAIVYGASGWGQHAFPFVGFAFAALLGLMVLRGLGRHRRHARHAGPWAHARGGWPHRSGPDAGIGPEKQPKDFV